MPTHIAFLEDVKNAKELIGKDIWLNDIFSDSIFMTQSRSSFKKFQKVNVGYNGKFRFVSRQNNYFIENPIRRSWDKNSIKNVMEGKIEYGMNSEQVRASMGNPDIINNTSSRHGVSEQWIYGKNIFSKRYLVFENGILSSM